MNTDTREKLIKLIEDIKIVALWSKIAGMKELADSAQDAIDALKSEYGYQMIAPIEFDKGQKARDVLELKLA